MAKTNKKRSTIVNILPEGTNVIMGDFMPSSELDIELKLKPGLYMFNNLYRYSKNCKEYAKTGFGVEISDGDVRTLNDLLQIINDGWSNLVIDPNHRFLEILHFDKRRKEFVCHFGS